MFIVILIIVAGLAYILSRIMLKSALKNRLEILESDFSYDNKATLTIRVQNFHSTTFYESFIQYLEEGIYETLGMLVSCKVDTIYDTDENIIDFKDFQKSDGQTITFKVDVSCNVITENTIDKQKVLNIKRTIRGLKTDEQIEEEVTYDAGKFVGIAVIVLSILFLLYLYKTNF